jgi:hypothetical protein
MRAAAGCFNRAQDMTAGDHHRPHPATAEDESPLARLVAERNAAWVQAHRARALERDAAELQVLLQRRKASLSWRLTAPLRQALPALGPRPQSQSDTPTPSDTSSARRA